MKQFKFLVAAIAIAMAAPMATAQFTTGGGSGSSADGDYLPQRGYRGFFDAGYSVGVGGGTGRIETSTVHGYQFSPYFFAGVGVGFSYFHEGEVWGLPIFADFRGEYGNFGTGRVAPFVDFRIGYTPTDISGFYMSPSVGVRYAINSNAGINLSLGYTMQKCEYYFSYGGYYGEGTANCGGFTIRLGIDF
ncbi:MAG: hypothetical protein ACI30W_00715 [Muribaculaceae bacterium]